MRTHKLKVAGWSSQVARQAHNLKVVGSNPAPATNFNLSSLKVAGWSSQVARQAHNLKVVGSNPAPATNFPFTSSQYSLQSLFVHKKKDRSFERP